MVNRDIYDPGDGGAAAIVAGLLLVVAVVVGYFFYFGIDSVQSRQIDLDVRPVVVKSMPAK